jgi:hypothetical protein
VPGSFGLVREILQLGSKSKRCGTDATSTSSVVGGNFEAVLYLSSGSVIVGGEEGAAMHVSRRSGCSGVLHVALKQQATLNHTRSTWRTNTTDKSCTGLCNKQCNGPQQ